MIRTYYKLNKIDRERFHTKGSMVHLFPSFEIKEPLDLETKLRIKNLLEGDVLLPENTLLDYEVSINGDRVDVFPKK